MRAKPKVLSVLVALALTMGLCPVAALAQDGSLLRSAQLSVQDSYSAKVDAFVANERWKNGVSWDDDQEPKLSAAVATASCAYAADFVKYVFDADSPEGGARFTDAQEVRSGDLIRIYSGASSGHWVVVRYRNGDALDTAEGDYLGKVSVASGRYSVSGSGIKEYTSRTNQPVYGFEGYHFRDADAAPASFAAGIYSLEPKCAPGKRLDVAEGSVEEGANVQLWESNGTAAQSWTVMSSGKGYTIAAGCSGMMLDVEGNGSASGTNVAQHAANGTGAQLWMLQATGDGYYWIQAANGLMLDVSGGRSDDGTNVWGWSPNSGSDAQKWKLIPIGEEVQAGVYTLAPGHAPGTRLDIDGASSDSGANVQIYQSNGSSAQMFGIVPASGDLVYKIKPQCSWMALDLEGGGTVSGANVRQRDDSDTLAQEWRFQATGDGYYYVRSETGLYLDVDGAGTKDGANVQGWEYNGTKAQQWKLVQLQDIAGAIVTVPDQVYTGSALKPVPTVKIGSTTLKKGTDFSVSYKGNTKVGTATVTVTGKGLYFGTNQARFEIVKEASSLSGGGSGQGDVSAKSTNVGAATVTGVVSKTYTGGMLTQNPTVKMGSTTLAKGIDFMLAYSNIVNAGTAEMKIVGKGAYTGTLSVRFTIKRAGVKKASVASIGPKVYAGKAIRPKPKITYKGKELVRGVDYKLSYKNNKGPGTATVTVKGKGNFKGSKTVEFEIR